MDLRLESVQGRSALLARYQQGQNTPDAFRITNHFDPRYKGMKAARLVARASAPTRLRISLREFNGSYTGPEFEAFYDLPAGKEWKSLSVPLSEFQLAGTSKASGVLNLAKIWLVLLEDVTPTAGAEDVELEIDSLSAVLVE
jgi:hypothetical protein